MWSSSGVTRRRLRALGGAVAWPTRAGGHTPSIRPSGSTRPARCTPSGCVQVPVVVRATAHFCVQPLQLIVQESVLGFDVVQVLDGCFEHRLRFTPAALARIRRRGRRGSGKYGCTIPTRPDHRSLQSVWSLLPSGCPDDFSSATTRPCARSAHRARWRSRRTAMARPVRFAAPGAPGASKPATAWGLAPMCAIASALGSR